jgi:hypothetical protein
MPVGRPPRLRDYVSINTSALEIRALRGSIDTTLAGCCKLYVLAL